MNRFLAKAYPVLIKQDEDDFLVYIPDFDTYTEGSSLADAIEMARDAMGTAGMEFKTEDELPVVSSFGAARAKAKEVADEELDFSDGLVTYVDIDFEAYQNRMRNKSVKKNCTIPFWLNEKAESMGVNFSKVLQDALIRIVGV